MAGATGRAAGSKQPPVGSRQPSPSPEPKEAGVPPLSDEDYASKRRLFKEIFSPCSPEIAKQASRSERQNASLLEDESLTYSEVDIGTMHDILNMVKRDHGVLQSGQGVFMDLGSGAGKAVIAAGLLHPFARVVGVERLECLNAFATAASERYREAELPEGAVKPEVQFMKGDFVGLMEGQEMQELAAEVVMCLAVSTCYVGDQMQALAKFGRAMSPGSFIITFTQVLPESLGSEARNWVLVHSELMKMMWGPATCFIYKKVPLTQAAGPADPSTDA